MDLIKGMLERRSINFFNPDAEVSNEMIETMIEVANTAPSSMNLQPWKIIVVKSKEGKELLRKAAFDQPKITESSAVIIVEAMRNAVEENMDDVLNSWVTLGYMTREQSEQYRGFASMLYGELDSQNRALFAVKNAAFFAMNLMTAARGFGLETHPIDGFIENDVKESFGIAEDSIVPILIAVGTKKDGIELLPRAFKRNVSKFTKFA